jgi:hypothetical protein
MPTALRATAKSRRALCQALAEEQMETNRIAKWFKDINGWLNPPGCESSIVSHPLHDSGCCTVGIVHEHRFAFYFWGLYSIDKDSPHAALISIDAHDDLDNLNIRNRTELGLFAWLRLRSLNDGHILPALYLNFFSDVYVLLNDREDSAAFKTARTEQQQRDGNGRIHTVKFYQNSEKLLYDLPPDCPVFLDIDLDYFAVDNPNAGSVLGSENLIPDAEIIVRANFEQNSWANHSAGAKILRWISQFTSCTGYSKSGAF